jgi:phosphoribosylamine--glycine ligase
MKILVVGNGAREHAIIWKLAQSPKAKKIFCAPGNAGTALLAENVNIGVENTDALLDFAQNNEIDLTIVGPEASLVAGIGNKFRDSGLKIFGPNLDGAILEGSKIYSKNFMKKYQIPTAAYRAYDDLELAKNGINEFSFPIVIKADGLAAGKGVLICENEYQAELALMDLMQHQKFGSAGNQIVIEEFLEGTEASLLCFVNGKSIIPMESARDYKRAFDNDEGLNTGGMGCFSPNSIFSGDNFDEIQTQILDKTMNGLLSENIDFRGILFIGLMFTNLGIKVLEYNVRFGDPETEVVLPRLESDFVEVIEKTIEGTLTAKDLKWTDKKAVTVIAASGGYPEKYEKGFEIFGLDTVNEDVMIFHAGTDFQNNKIVTNGGRVLAVTALGDTLEQARQKVYLNIEKLHFNGIFYRKDITK